MEADRLRASLKFTSPTVSLALQLQVCAPRHQLPGPRKCLYGLKSPRHRGPKWALLGGKTPGGKCPLPPSFHAPLFPGGRLRGGPVFPSPRGFLGGLLPSSAPSSAWLRALEWDTRLRSLEWLTSAWRGYSLFLCHLAIPSHFPENARGSIFYF